MRTVYFDQDGKLYDQHAEGLTTLAVEDWVNINRDFIPDILHPETSPKPVLSRPTIYHEFDIEQWRWVLSPGALSQAKTDKKNQLTHLADIIHNSPILYDNKLLDADQTARENITGKVNQLQAEIALNITSTDLVWKDANNTLHVFETVEGYMAFLQGLTIAIAARRSNLYAQIWQYKAEIDAMTAVENIVVFQFELS